ncbi:translocation protein sec62 domain-containing protein [Ditylenchus destructor]|nr:translocation protein sec62 domain-containing protein [Ditylenchus destructor]
MSDRKSKKKAKTEAPPNKLTKEEDAIARFIRFNCPTNSTMFEGNEVHYFAGKKAVDLLVESKKYGTNAKVPKFANAMVAEDFLQSLLERGLFFRAKKTPKSGKEQKAEKKTKEESIKSKEDVKDESERKEENEDANSEDENKDEDKKADEPLQEEECKKKKKKVKLIAHDIQTFVVDPSDVFVWIFDPTPFFKKMIGLLIVLGTIAGCLFPLWPDWLRLGIYYLSVTGIICFGVLLGLALARTILFGIIWACTLGRHKLWVLPNLTEDCGFFESFKPFYTYEYVPGGAFGPNSADKKKDKSSKEKKRSSDTLAAAGDADQSEKSTTATPDVRKKSKKKSKNEEEQPLLEKDGENEEASPSTSKSEKSKSKADYRKRASDEEDNGADSESCSGQDDEEDENHPSDEISDQSNASSEDKSDNERASQDEGSNSQNVRRRRKDRKREKKENKDESPTNGDDDFVIIDNTNNH